MPRPYAVHSAISCRLSALSELERKLKRCKEEDDRLKIELMALVPKKLRPWFKNEDVLAHVFDYGFCSTKIYFNCRSDVCGFKGAKDARAAMKKLAEVWKDNVTVHLESQIDDNCRIGVRFGVTPL